MYCLGIDTSCYTTSVAAVNESLELCFDGRIILDVPEGGRGLRQSDAFYRHIGNLSRLMEQCMETLEAGSIMGIAVTSKPRNTESSYMPVFSAGVHTAKTIGSMLKLPVVETAHQDSHIQAGLWSSGQQLKPDFLAYHISGGTTELLHVHKNTTMDISVIGGTGDLNAGQFIDRIGVAMGMKFPCGQEMDRLCGIFDTKGIKIPISVKGFFLSFSGPESHVQRLLKGKAPDSEEAAAIAKGVFLCIAASIEETVLNAKTKYDLDELLLIGGVASNSTIKKYLTESHKLKKCGVRPVFSDPRFSPDNAVGTAVLGMKALARNGRREK